MWVTQQIYKRLKLKPRASDVEFENGVAAIEDDEGCTTLVLVPPTRVELPRHELMGKLSTLHEQAAETTTNMETCKHPVARDVKLVPRLDNVMLSLLTEVAANNGSMHGREEAFKRLVEASLAHRYGCAWGVLPSCDHTSACHSHSEPASVPHIVLP